MHLVYLPRADDDFLDLYLHIAIDNETAADRMIDRLRVAILRLRDYPRSAPARAELGSDIRGLSVAGFVVLYRVNGDRVEILRVLHGARNLPNA